MGNFATNYSYTSRSVNKNYGKYLNTCTYPKDFQIRSLNPERGFEWTVDRPLLDSRRFHFTPDRDGYVLGGQEDTVNVSMTPRTFNRAGDGPTHVTLVIGLEEQPVEVRVFYLPQSLAATPPPSPESDSE